MKVLALGTCMARMLISAGQESGHQVDHYLYNLVGRQALAPLRDRDLTGYDFFLISPTLRALIAAASGEGNELAFWRGEPDAPTLLENCDTLIARALEEVAELLDGALTVVQGVLEPSASYVGPVHR